MTDTTEATVHRLTVLYDSSCKLCRSARTWLEKQPSWVPLEFVAAGSDEAKRRFPQILVPRSLCELHAIDDGGGVYRGEKAWLMCLWALTDYRAMALRLAESPFRDRAKHFVGWVARKRYRFGRRAHA